MRDIDEDDEYAPTSLDPIAGRLAHAYAPTEPPALSREVASAAPIAGPSAAPSLAPAHPPEPSVPRTAVLPLTGGQEEPAVSGIVPKTAVLPLTQQAEPDDDDVAVTELDRRVFDPRQPARQGAPRVAAPPARALPVAPSTDGSDFGLKVALYVLVALIVVISVALVVGIAFAI